MSYAPPPYAPDPSDRKIIPATCLLSSKKKDGANCASVTFDVADPNDVVTTTCTDPVAVSFGACTLIYVGRTYERYAALPLIVTLVPASDVGKVPVHDAVPLARLFP